MIDEPKTQEALSDNDGETSAASLGEEVTEQPEGMAEQEASEEEQSPFLTISGSENLAMKWYVIQVYSGFEEKAKAALIQKAKDKKCDHLFGQVHIAQTHTETKTKTGKKRVLSRSAFPGYMMVQLELNDASKLLIKETPKINGFVGDSSNPKPLSEREVMALLGGAQTDDAEQSTVVTPQVLYNKGDAVRVIDGPFSNFDGVIDEVRPEKMKVRVLVSIFGRETPVELEYKQIEQT